MQRKYILFALVVIFLICSPVAASTKKVARGAPVFIGENDLDIGSAVQDCKVIAWWPEGKDMTDPAATNITIKRVNDYVLSVSHFNISPDIFSGHTGNWYCEDKKPQFVVLTVLQPELAIRVWDQGNNSDISGQAVTVQTNITYRIDTNLGQVLDYTKRPDLTPADGFFTVELKNPAGKTMLNLYSGSVKGTGTKIFSFDTNPYITASPYYGKSLESWNRLSRDETGGLLYPAGTYTFTVTQDLNGMKKSYASANASTRDGVVTSTANVTFLPYDIFSPPVTPTLSENATVTATAEETTQPVETSAKPTVSAPVTKPSAVATKTTYSPVPAWVALAGVLAALVFTARMRQ